MIKRVFNYRPDYDPELTGNTVTGNYYPINSAIYIEDPKSTLRLT